MRRAYLVFLPAGGECEVDLGAGRGPFAVEWRSADRSEPQAGGSVAGGGRRALQAPFAGPAVLFLAALPN